MKWTSSIPILLLTISSLSVWPASRVHERPGSPSRNLICGGNLTIEPIGDGVSADGSGVSHAYTQPRQYTVIVTATGLNGQATQKALTISVTGMIPTACNPAEKVRYSGAK